MALKIVSFIGHLFQMINLDSKSLCMLNDPIQSNVYDTLSLLMSLSVLLILVIYLALCRFNTVQVMSQWAGLWVEEISTYSWSRFCIVNCQPTARNY